MSGHGSFWGHFWLAKLFLQFAGLLPIGGSSCLWKSFLNQFLATLPLWTSFYILIPEFKYIFFQSPDIDSFLEAVLITISVLTYQLRSIFVVVYRHRITRLFLVCETMWNEAVPADYSVIFIWAKRAKRISTIYFCGAYCSVITFAVTSTVKQLSSAENSTTKYYPFAPEEDSTPTPQYQIKFGTQVLISYIGIAYIAACDMTGTILALNMCGQLALIQSWLADVSGENVCTRDRKTDQNLHNVLMKCARRHQIVLDFCSELGDVIRYNYLIQIVTEMYIMAVSGARLSQGSGSVQHLSTLLLAINGLLFSCWPADTLSCQSTEIAQAAYEVPWHRGSSREKTMVAVMIARSQRPATLSAGNFIKLSLQTFSSITSNGLSFCMVLLNI
ncbi:odorant receptor 13a-like [Neodiprion pinetum]|uniref:odorant receptor 13a-like n=1 Tax=Neodiprion pinetum TaxID=441929 RepID=UPI001EDD53DC|nr:odorant receptor 49b-like [Neodiprion pinetum]